RRLRPEFRIWIPNRIKQHQHRPDVVLCANRKKFIEPLRESSRILLPEQIMQEHAHRVQPDRFRPAKLQINALRVERLCLPHLYLVRSRRRNVIAPDEPWLLRVPRLGLLSAPPRRLVTLMWYGHWLCAVFRSRHSASNNQESCKYHRAFPCASHSVLREGTTSVLRSDIPYTMSRELNSGEFSHHEIAPLRPHRLASQRNWLWHVGHGRLDRLRRHGVTRRAAALHRSWLQFFLYGLGLRRWPQRGASWQNAPRESFKETLHRYENPTEKSSLAGAQGIFSRRLLSARLCFRTRGQKPQKSRPRYA